MSTDLTKVQTQSHRRGDTTSTSPEPVEQPKPTNVIAYIDKVIEDSCKAEDRPNDVKYEYMVIAEDKTFLFAINSKYLKVMRRVVYRLKNNFQKNFGLTFNLIYPYSANWREFYDGNTYDLYSIDQGIDANHSCLDITVFGRKYTLRNIYGVRPDASENPDGIWNLGIPHLNRLKEFGFDYMAKYDPDEVWGIYLQAYIKAYGEPPLKMAIIQEKYYKQLKAEAAKKDEVPKEPGRSYMEDKEYQMNLEKKHREQYAADLAAMGCGYYSVCGDHACPCSPDAPVMKGFDEFIWNKMAKEMY